MRALRILLALWALAAAEAGAAPPDYPAVTAGAGFAFPVDHGAHPDYRTEWWYLTGWLALPDGSPLGFQVTFFRSRPAIDQANPSAFAARQILFAHAALSDPARAMLVHDQRIARAGFGLAEAAIGDADITIDDWRLVRRADGRFAATIEARDFALTLDAEPTQPVLLEGAGGYSRKGPRPSDASYYYSIPHLKVTGTVRRATGTAVVRGEAWLDREWSSSLLDPAAVGWDWTGLNLDDGGAVMAFRMRDRSGATLWAGATVRRADGSAVSLGPDAVGFGTRRQWHSPRTGIDYPVERDLTLDLGGETRRFSLKPLFDDQELDSRAGGGPIYWEGAVTTESGRGYLELTGYGAPLKF